MKRAEKIYKLVHDLEYVPTSVRILNNVVNIAASAVATSIAIEIVGITHGVAIAIVVMTILILTSRPLYHTKDDPLE